MSKKTLSLVLALVMVLGSINIVTAATGNKKVDSLIEKGLVTGDEGGYRLKDTIRRSEVAAMIVRALNLEDMAKTLQDIPSKFSDMNSKDVLWARGYVNYVSSDNYVNGYPNGTFGPKRDITYAEVIKILVMVNGDIPVTTGFDGKLWAVPYITKANEIGITEGVSITNNDYNQPATREKVFEMIYNTINLLEGAEQEVYKGIVTENSRVSKLGDDEIRLVVISKGTNSPQATFRYDKDDEIKIKLPKEFDSEALLGKVVDITIDKNNNAVKVTVDTSYSYINGPISASEDEITLENNKSYDVYLENRYNNSPDRIYKVYHNDKEYDYDDFVSDLDASDGSKDGEFVAEYAKVTVKGDRTYFIDSFTFDDIAPIVEVKKSGEEIYVYDDVASANKAEYNLKKVFGYSKGDYSQLGLGDIKVGTVVHIYNVDRAIVRQDAEYFGEYDRVLEANDVYYAEIDGQRHLLRNSSYKRPIYSLDGNKYVTLMVSSASSALSDLKDQEVRYLLDASGHIQLIAGEIDFNENTVIIDGIGTRDIKVIEPNGNEKTYKVDNYSDLYIANLNTKSSLSDFDRGNIVYLFNDGDVVDTLIKMATIENISSGASKVMKTSKGQFDINLNNSWIRLESGIYELNSSTNIYTVETNGNSVSNIEATTLAKVKEKADVKSDLKAYVITEKDFNKLNIKNKKQVGTSDVMAHTIIFTDFEIDDSFLDIETVELAFDYKSNSSDVIIGKDTKGKETQYKVMKNANIPSLKAKDILTLSINEDGYVIEAKERIKGSNKVYEVLDTHSVSKKLDSITIKTSSGEEEMFVSRDLSIFGSTKIKKGDKIAFDVDEDGDIQVIVVY